MRETGSEGVCSLNAAACSQAERRQVWRRSDQKCQDLWPRLFSGALEDSRCNRTFCLLHRQ